MRELKHDKNLYEQSGLSCRTFTGAWIETELTVKSAYVYQVAPSRVRELKQHIVNDSWKDFVAPSRVRELKPRKTKI